MIHLIKEDQEKEEINKAFIKLFNSNASLPEYLLYEKKISYFFNESFILRDFIFNLLRENYNFSSKGYIAVSINKDVLFFKSKNATYENFVEFFDGKFIGNDHQLGFGDIFYSDFILLFDHSKKWAYYHTIDLPNVLFSDDAIEAQDIPVLDLNEVEEYFPVKYAGLKDFFV